MADGKQKASEILQSQIKAFQAEGLEERYERYKEKIRRYTIMDDIFMRTVFKDKDCVEYILQVIMNKKDLQVIDQILQQDYKNLQGRSAVLDCVARDETFRQYNIEIQGDKKDGASPKRARYHSGLLDMNTLKPGEDFNKLPETYVIFITRKDELGYNRPICHIDRMVREEDDEFGDEEHIIYVNSKKQEDTELGRLMHDLHCKDAKEMHSDILSNRVYELKETKKGVEEMCRDMEEIYGEGMENGRILGLKEGEEMGRILGLKEGGEKKARETACILADMGMPIEQIAQAVRMPVEVARGWIEESMAVRRQ